MLNRAPDESRMNHKRVYRVMRQAALLLPKYTGRVRLQHDGKVITLASDMRWCSDALAIRCWSGEKVQVAFSLDCCERQAISWVAADRHLDGGDMRDLMAMSIEARFGEARTPRPIEWFSDHGGPFTANLTRAFGGASGPIAAKAPAYSPEFMKTVGAERDLVVLNRMLERWVVEIAGQRIHGTTYRKPLEHFEQTEKRVLLPLPKQRWEPVWWREPKIHRDCCALVEKARYSVPWRLVGRKLLARVTAMSVELYWEDARVATHQRQPAGGKSVRSEHPPERGDYRIRERGHWVERAEALGDDVARYIGEVFDSDDVLHQLNKVQSIVRHLEKFPRERANAACRRASFYGNYGYGPIKQILRKGLDLEPLPQVTVPTSGALETPRFARDVQEILDFTPKDTNAPH